MDEPNRPAKRPALTIVVALAVVALGIAVIALVGPGERAALQPPEQIGNLRRTPSEEVSTPRDLIATYTGGSTVAVLSVHRAQAADTLAHCTTESAATQCVWTSEDLSYTLVVNSAETQATSDLAAQATQAVQAVNH